MVPTDYDIPYDMRYIFKEFSNIKTYNVQRPFDLQFARKMVCGGGEIGGMRF